MILKILIIAGIIALLYFIYMKNKAAALNSKKEAKEEKQKEKEKEKAKANEMVECSKCKIYCELNDTLLSNGKYYCSKECLEKIK
ncbi:MAG: PP0621 family protein [Sulfurimonas sp.]|uniref:PP0621 family protein n=1 Tax=Sulfurimonas sp. TaxID=2022749 RepID=UPI00261858AD|nr:PP0621 family protein [Sulfurimonas sp.]MDD5373829.1 PP0621 family protein [Sulfurimonas sp.]